MLMDRSGYNPVPKSSPFLCHVSIFIAVLQNCATCVDRWECEAMRLPVGEGAIAMFLWEAAEPRALMAL